MANKYLASVPDGRSGVRDLFGTIAPYYDLINDLQSFGLHRYWKRQMLQFSRIQPGERVLDLCCGTGDVALSFAQSGGEVVGLDFSGHMLRIARTRLSAVQGVNFIQGDALRIPFESASFDVATISYGLRNLRSLDKGLEEMLRVLRPGGRLLILDFGKPPNFLWRKLFFCYLRYVVPVFGKLFFGDSQTHSYILETLHHYPAQDGVSASLEGLPCQRILVKNFLGGVMSIHYAEKSV